MKLAPEITQLLRVFVVQGVGRPSHLGVSRPTDKRLLQMAVSLHDLQVFAMLNPGDALSLWQATTALDDLPPSSSMIHFGFLDHYAHYRAQEHSYVVPDDTLPDMALYLGSGAPLRREAQLLHDPHYVRAPFGDHFILLRRLEHRRELSVYKPVNRTTTPMLAVETNAARIWVTSADSSHATRDTDSFSSIHAVDVTASWLWQLSSHLDRIAAERLVPESSVIFSVTSPQEADQHPAPLRLHHSSVTWERIGERECQIQFHPNFYDGCCQPDNRVERELARLLLTAFADICGTPGLLPIF